VTIVSASTLCAEPRNLTPGEPRSYNIVEVDTIARSGRVHQRKMVNRDFSLPVWGPGHFIITNNSYCDFELSMPVMRRSAELDLHLLLEHADDALGSRRWSDALALLKKVRDLPLARPLLVRALVELDNARCIVNVLWPPRTIGEAVTVGGAILECGTVEEVNAFLHLKLVLDTTDASLRDISRRIKERRLS
jgi:hypothetical protein